MVLTIDGDPTNRVSPVGRAPFSSGIVASNPVQSAMPGMSLSVANTSANSSSNSSRRCFSDNVTIGLT